MAEAVGSLRAELTLDDAEFKKSIQDLNRQMKVIDSEFKAVSSSAKVYGNETEKLKALQDTLTKRLEVQREKVEQLKRRYDEVAAAKGADSKEAQQLEIAYNNATAAMQKTEGQLKSVSERLKEQTDVWQKLKSSLKDAGESIKDAGKKLQDVGKELSLKVTAPILAVGTVATKAAIDFESAFAGVRKTVDATEEEFAQLESGIRDMSKRMPASATEIAAVAEAAGQLGIETPNILKFTETMIGLGEATNLTAEEGASQFARFANIVGMSQQDFDRLGSAVVALGNNMATTEAEIVAMGMRLAGQGAQIGMTEAQIMALAAAMSSVGIEAEAGGTAMSTILKKMQVAVDESGESLSAFAKVARMSSREFADAFRRDPAAALQAFVDGLAASSSEGANLTMILNELGISGIRESDTLLRLAGASDVLRGALDTATQAWNENTALQNEVAQRYATTESQLKMLKNKIQDIAITLGQALIPAVTDALNAMQPAIDWVARLATSFTELDAGTQRAIITIAAIVAALGPVVSVVGTVVQVFGSFISALGALISPVGLVVVAIAGLAAAAFLIVKNWEPIKGFFIDLWDGIKNIFSAAWEWMKNFLKDWGPAILAIIAPVLGIPLLIAQHWDKIKAFNQELWDGVVSYLSGVWNGLSSTAKTAFDGLVNTIRPILEGLKTFFTGIWEAIKNIFAGALLLIIDLVTGDFENLSKDAQGIWNNLKDAFANIWGGIKQVFYGALDIIKNAIAEAWSNIKSATETAWNAIKLVITKIITSTMTWIKDTWTGLLNWFRELPDKLYQIGKDMFERMRDAVVTTVVRVKDAIVTGVSQAIDWLRELPSTLYSIGVDIIRGLVDGIKSMIGSVKNAVKSVADTVSGGIRNLLDIRSPSKLMMKYGAYIAEGLARGITGAQGLVEKASDKLGELAVPTILTPRLGGITGAEALTAGSVVSSPTLETVGREAVVPPSAGALNANFSALDEDRLAQAVYQAVLTAMRVTQAPSAQSSDREVVLRLDSKTVARAILPSIIAEGQRQGLNLVVRPQGV